MTKVGKTKLKRNKRLVRLVKQGWPYSSVGRVLGITLKTAREVFLKYRDRFDIEIKDKDRVYTAKEVAGILNVHRETIYLYEKQGKIHSVSLDGVIKRYTHKEIERAKIVRSWA